MDVSVTVTCYLVPFKVKIEIYQILQKQKCPFYLAFNPFFYDLYYTPS